MFYLHMSIFINFCHDRHGGVLFLTFPVALMRHQPMFIFNFFLFATNNFVLHQTNLQNIHSTACWLHCCAACNDRIRLWLLPYVGQCALFSNEKQTIIDLFSIQRLAVIFWKQPVMFVSKCMCNLLKGKLKSSAG